jgi:hypothetical protein
MHKKEIIALITGFIIAVGGGLGFSYYQNHLADPYGGYYDQIVAEYHIHADFAIYLNDTRLQLTDEKYMSSVEQIIHPDLHLHDGNQDLLHIHAEGLTFSNFLESIGMPLTNDCMTDERGFQHCTGGGQELALFVNGERVSDIVGYVPKDEDRILLYYGNLSNPNITGYVAGITDQACIYTGTCPERGTPPPEACGLTCEI